jgi:DNA-binding CsgD family transcriptional regulator
MFTKPLTRKEKEVVLCILEGMTNDQTAESLKISEKTVKFHLTKIYKKAAVKTRTQLALKVFPLIRELRDSVVFNSMTSIQNIQSSGPLTSR